MATEAKFRRAFRENYADTTNLIIAQRVSSVMNADRILVIDEGKIVAFGKHAELMESWRFIGKPTNHSKKDIFLQFFRNLSGYSHIGKAKNYLYTIARNLCNNYHKKKKMLVLNHK